MKTQPGLFRRAIRTAPAVLPLVACLMVNASCSHFPSGSGGTTGKTPTVNLSTNTIPFGSIPQGVTSQTMSVTLMNTGSVSLTFTANPSVTGTNASDFAITGSTCSTASPLTGNSSCTVTLTFKPSTMAAESASLVFTDNASPTTQTVMLTGTGTAAAPVVVLMPNTLPFGPVAQGTTSSAMTVTVDNIGNATLIFSSAVNITGTNAGDFKIVNLMASSCQPSFQVVAGGSCTIQVELTPSTSGPESASLNFADNANPASQTVSLTGGASSSTSNSVTLTVDSGPLGGDLNRPFISVTVCVPGSTVNCQTINHIVVDTGSVGLRLEASQLNIALPPVTDSSGNALGDCVQFADMSYAFGPVQSADIKLAGETAPSVPIQVIGAVGFASAPPDCATAIGVNLDTVAAFGANGIIGVGVRKQDCGQACVTAAVSAHYYSCPSNICTNTALPLAKQLQNAVSLFPVDNQGVLISLPAISSSGALTVTGSLIFGIGTQADNALGTAQVITTDANGEFTATYSGSQYSGSVLDSGSNGIFFLNLTPPGFPACADYLGFYCPTSTTAFVTTIKGATNNAIPADFSIADIDALGTASNFQDAAYSNAGGPGAAGLGFDYGLAFFYGRNVFTCITGQTVGTFTGPFVAY